MTGAPVLAARAALRVGAGLVTVAAPSSLNEILEVKLTEVMTLPCRETSARVFAEDAGREALTAAEGADALAIGPGLSRARSATAFAQEMALTVRAPAVIDADGLNAFEGQTDALAEADGPRVLTPHPGEAARLLDERVARVRKDPIVACRTLAETTRAVVLLKGAPTVLCDGRGAPAVRNVVVNPTGNAGLATGGSGDVLTGIITGLIAQGLDPFDAAALGAFLHGATGDIGVDRLTQWGLVAGDLVELLPETMGLLDEGEDLAPWIA
jgi:NAD(P)H-hydrate epimerase